MIKRAHQICIAIFLSVFLTPLAHGGETVLTKALISKTDIGILNTGGVLINVEKIFDQNGKSARMFSAVQIEASPEAIWTVLTDCSRAASYVPGLKKCEILEAEKEKTWPEKTWDIRRHTIKPVSFLPKMISEFRCDYVYAKSINFHSVGGDMDTNTGRWTLTPNKDRTKTTVTYQAQIVAKTIVPDKMIRKTMKKNLPKVMRGLRKEVMSDKAKLAGSHAQEPKIGSINAQ